MEEPNGGANHARRQGVHWRHPFPPSEEEENEKDGEKEEKNVDFKMQKLTLKCSKIGQISKIFRLRCL